MIADEAHQEDEEVIEEAVAETEEAEVSKYNSMKGRMLNITGGFRGGDRGRGAPRGRGGRGDRGGRGGRGGRPGLKGGMKVVVVRLSLSSVCYVAKINTGTTQTPRSLHCSRQRRHASHKEPHTWRIRLRRETNRD